MVEKIVNHIVDCQISLGRIKQEESGVYQYGYTLFFEKLINIAIVILICIVTNKWLEIWSFLLAVIPLRSFAGGWHANKFWQCAIISNFMVALMLLIIDKVSIENEVIYIVFEIIVLFIILLIIPTQNSNKPLTPAELKKYKKITIFIWIIECCIMSIFVIYRKYIYSIIILYTHSIIVIAAIGGKISEMRKVKRKNMQHID